MAQYSENYYNRKCMLQRNQVPTQSIMIKTMKPALAAIYFQSMSPKLKILAGLEPLLKGGGSDWYVPPADILQGKIVMRPFHKKYMGQLSCLGVDEIGMKLVVIHRERMKNMRDQLIVENDARWREKLDIEIRAEWLERSAAAKQQNTNYINNAVQNFTTMYRTSLTKIQSVLLDAAVAQIKKYREETYERSEKRFKDLVQKQAVKLYKMYHEKLTREKARLKADFIQSVEVSRSTLSHKLHHINLDKHAAVEKLRHFLESQKLACQIYITLKENQECLKEIEQMTYKHGKKVKTLTSKIERQDIELRIAEEKLQGRKQLDTIWSKKVCHVIKKFQTFVKYCLNLLPEHAEFFINMEKLMLLQLNEVLECPCAPSIFIVDKESYHTPLPKPHPFYLFCDKRYQTEVDPDLCPIRCTSSATHMPVIIVNKRCIYAACDNFQQYTDQIKDYIDGNLGDANDFVDNRDYTLDVPIKYTTSTQLEELKLQGSLFQLLQQEIANLKAIPLECPGCKMPYCYYCSRLAHDETGTEPSKLENDLSSSSMSSDLEIRDQETVVIHEKEPKWESFSRYVKPKRCHCSKIVKKDLYQNLPPYMRKMSKYESPELPKYETCPLVYLKDLVKKSRGKIDKLPQPALPSNRNEIGIQVCDSDFEYLCNCFSDAHINDFICNLNPPTISARDSSYNHFAIAGSYMSGSLLHKDSKSFAIERAMSLKRLIEQSSDIKVLMEKRDCDSSHYLY